jgi:hypothetical protein
MDGRVEHGHDGNSAALSADLAETLDGIRHLRKTGYPIRGTAV